MIYVWESEWQKKIMINCLEKYKTEEKKFACVLVPSLLQIIFPMKAGLGWVGDEMVIEIFVFCTQSLPTKCACVHDQLQLVPANCAHLLPSVNSKPFL